MYFRKSAYLVLFLILISSQMINASHYMGGEISYEHISGNDYKVRLKIVRDCSGVPLSTSMTIDITSPGSASSSLIMNKISTTDVTQLCPGQQSRCSSPNVGLFGSEEHIFEATRSFPPLANNASYTLALTAACCRNNAITNLQSPAGYQMYLYTTLHPNLTIKNNSPKILNRAVAYFCNNRPAVISPNAYDKDGDQLRYSFVAPKTVGNSPIPYTPGLSVTNPLVCSSPITINPTTGEIRFTPSQQQVAVLSVLVEEFRGGIQIGSMIHEMQIWITNCTNTPPVINPVSSQIATVGSSLCIPIVATDADNNNIALSAVSGLMSQGATFVLNNSTAGASAGTFCFTPTAANQGQTYTVTINARDNQCPVAASTAMSFNITVSANCPKTGVSFVTTPATCGLNSGTATATLSPVGIPPYSYFWTGAGNFTAFTQQITGLAAGNYSVTVIDARGCIGQNTVAVGRADQLQQIGNVSHATCKLKNGAISVTAVGGTPPYTYKLNGGAGQPVGNFTGLNAGTYTVQVTDANGCNGQATYVVTSSIDTMKPTIICPHNLVKVMSPIKATSMTIAIGSPLVTDNCGIASVVKNGPTSYPAGITNVTWTVTDTSGNQNTCTQKIEVRSKMTSIPAVKEVK